MSLYIGNQKVTPTIVTRTSDVSIPLEVTSNGELQKPTTPFTWSLPSNVTDVKTNGLYYAFYNCLGLTSVDLSSLTTISGNNAFTSAFRKCENLTNVDFSNLRTISGSYALRLAFMDCYELLILSFPSLTSTSFGSRTNQFTEMLSGIDNCVVHFPSNLQSVIGSWDDVLGGFGGNNTTVLFDLPATT